MGEQLDVLKINGGKYGIINLNNMIPVTKSSLIALDIKKKSRSNDTKELNYANLLINQIEWCRKNEDKILLKASVLYNYYNKNTLHDNVRSRCCDFKLLEKACLEYEGINAEKEVASTVEKIDKPNNNKQTEITRQPQKPIRRQKLKSREIDEDERET